MKAKATIHRRLSVEELEPRVAPVTLTVNSLADDTTGGNGLVTLREAITAANSDGTTGRDSCTLL